MIKLTEALVLDLLDEAVAEKGEDHLYSNPDDPGSCVYVHGVETIETYDEYEELIDREFVPTDNLTPGCIVGNVLHRAGVPLETFLELGINHDTVAAVALYNLSRHGVVEYSDRIEQILSSAQSRQDGNAPWGKAVADTRLMYCE